MIETNGRIGLIGKDVGLMRKKEASGFLEMLF